MPRITKEHYDLFVEAIEQQLQELAKDLKGYEDIEPWEFDGSAEMDRQDLDRFYGHYYHLKGLTAEVRFVEFESLEALEIYVDNLTCTLTSLSDLSKQLLPKDSEEFVGVTYEEWDKVEHAKIVVSNLATWWNEFYDFVEQGRLM